MHQTHRFALPALAALALAACGKSEAPAAPAVAPTELAAIETPPPAYPIELACAGAGGQTVLKVTVGPEGTPTEVALVKSSGQTQLDQLAQEKVREWKFRAATRNGQPVAQTIQVPVDFKPPVPKPDECFAIEERAKRGG
ncbi:energy transducer TonB [Stenotrophomonas panacihumi]|uniref:Energy transducer TonB n=1 Tax=Stenotrophomonas panacihumi TaxID=676599 RepID=A0A0R0AQ07_9GAMM|nr:energy transducer TonB [Stenotrophomonas panacihumi]KRG47311.1 energy transducer TonB [Stenotrophomonas panacihumi]PTN55788.1 energy transducer TonB [Stenotrophomonas panacihumi]